MVRPLLVMSLTLWFSQAVHRLLCLFHVVALVWSSRCVSLSLFASSFVGAFVLHVTCSLFLPLSMKRRNRNVRFISYRMSLSLGQTLAGI